MDQWLLASQYAVGEAPEVSRIWLQSWDEVGESLCLTDTLEHRRFYINAIPALKSFSQKFNAQNKPSRGDDRWEAYVRRVVCTAYSAIFGPGPVRPAHRHTVSEGIRLLSDGQVNEEQVFWFFCYHRDNIKRWPPVISLHVQDVVNKISENGVDPSFTMKVSYKNFGPSKCLSSRFMIYLPLRVRCADKPFNEDKVFRLCAYVKPLGWDEENSEHLRAALCPNRLEFRWPFYHTGEEYGDPPREFFVKITGNEVKRFFRRALIRLRDGKQVDKWDGIGAGKDPRTRQRGDDDYEVSGENPDPEEGEEGKAKAPFHATFTAHFAEGSARFPGYDHEKLIRIPITNGVEVWYGCQP